MAKVPPKRAHNFVMLVCLLASTSMPSEMSVGVVDGLVR